MCTNEHFEYEYSIKIIFFESPRLESYKRWDFKA